MNRNKHLYSMVTAALLCAIGIIIPIFMPKISLEPASFTLASHVAIFIAMFISPGVTIAVCIGTTVGFFFSFPLVVVLRAASQIIFATIGAFMLKKSPDILQSPKKCALFALLMSIIHALGEIAVVIPFYFGNNMSSGYYENGFLVAVVLLVGVGTLLHSLVDFVIARIVWKPVKKVLKV